VAILGTLNHRVRFVSATKWNTDRVRCYNGLSQNRIRTGFGWHFEQRAEPGDCHGPFRCCPASYDTEDLNLLICSCIGTQVFSTRLQSSMAILIALFLLMLPDLKTVPKVDLQKYSGVWYEIARLPNKFQKDCAGDVRAEYTLQEGGTIKVVNRCRQTGKPKPKEAEGVARVAREDNGSNAILEVRFAPAILSFLDSVWGDYRIIALDDDYRYALVGSNDRRYLWILSRTKTLDDDVYKRLLATALKQGFSVNQVIRTPHT
jgi:apolipoprotein D and lipocalin family protein